MSRPPLNPTRVLEAATRDFDETAMAVFHHQCTHNPVYAHYVRLIDIDPQRISKVEDIPCLPIRFFKTHRVYGATTEPQQIFTSSATTGMTPSKHFVAATALYEQSVLQGFTQCYGDPTRYVILALLPSYLERSGSSLVYMVQYLMEQSGRPENGFYLYNHQQLFDTMQQCAQRHLPIWLIGVSFALLDFAAHYHMDYEALTILETGGMKGRGQEISRDRLHAVLNQSFPAQPIHSEYGMAELLSQAYCTSVDQRFTCPPWMRVAVRNLQDPFAQEKDGIRGGINIIDLANVHSCSFIETEDLGMRFPNGQFAVEGRIPHAVRRGCNMLTE